MRTCFPSASSANAIASCEPMESPSGRACDVSRKRRRRRISYRICRSAAAVASSFAGSFVISGIVELQEDSLDAVALLDRFVVEESELGHALQADPLADLPAQERHGARERAGGFLPRRVVPDGRVVNPCLLQIRRDLDVGDGQEPDARIMNRPAQKFRELRTNLIADTGGS